MGRIVSVTGLNLLARAAHLLLFLLIGNRFGANPATDAVFFLYAPLAVLVSVSAGAAEVVVMPALHRAERLGCHAEVRRALLRLGVFAVAPIGIVVVGVSWLLTGEVPLAAALILLPIPGLAVASAVRMGVLNSEARYSRAVLGPLYGGLLAAGVVLLVPTSAAGLAASLLVYEIGRALGLYLHSSPRQPGAPGRRRASRKVMGWALRRGGIQALGSFLVAMNPFVDILFARPFGEGAVTSVEYAGRLWNLVPMLFAGHLAVTYGRMSRDVAGGVLNHREVTALAVRTGLVAALVSIVALALSTPMVNVLYGRGAMSPESRQTLAGLLSFYFLGAGPFVAGLMYTRALSARGRVDVLARVAGISVVSNALLNWALTRGLGLDGIGLATSLSYLLGFLLMAYWWRR